MRPVLSFSSSRTIRKITTTTTTSSSGPIDEILAASFAKQFADTGDFDHLGALTTSQTISSAADGQDGGESLKTIVTQFVQEEQKQH